MSLDTLKQLPINIDLLKVEEKDLIKLGKITELSIFDNMNNFHTAGLFSITIFGAVGSEARNRTFGYIDLNVTIIHPLIYHAIINLKAFYKQIAEGKVTAIYDSKTKSFVKSSEPEASTGYHFFMSHIELLDFEENESEKRSFLIKLFKKSVKEKTYAMRYLLVLPAGIRDYHVDHNGKPQEDEINTFYRKLVSQSSIIDHISYKKAPDLYDNVAIGLQNTSADLFEYIKSLLEGKNKLILGKWLSRKIFNSTRNVASNIIDKSDSVDDINRVKYNECLVGIHQYLRVLVPKSLYEIKNKYIKDLFIDNSNTAYLTNVKTLKREEVFNAHIQKDYDTWTSSDGLMNVIASLGNQDLRNLPVKLNKGKHYLGLVYRDEKYFKFISDIDEVPETFNRDNVTPVTLAEFLYMSTYETNGKYPGLITRYPITGFGSIYPAYMKFITTSGGYVLEELDEQWQPTGKIASSFPNKNGEYQNAIGVHVSHVAPLTLDFDGDTLSLTSITTDEALKEVETYLNKKEYYMTDSGGFAFSSNSDVLNAVLSFMTN